MGLVRRVIDHTFTPETFYQWPQSVNSGQMLNDIGLAYMSLPTNGLLDTLRRYHAWVTGTFAIQNLDHTEKTPKPPAYARYLVEQCKFSTSAICPSKGLIVAASINHIDMSQFLGREQTLILKEIDLYALAYLYTKDIEAKLDILRAADYIWDRYGESVFTPACREAVSAAARRATYSL
jgi:hypothetical protein